MSIWKSMWKWKIELSQDQWALVSKKDYDRLSKYRWGAYWNKDIKSFYAVRKAKLPSGRWTTIQMAREILGLERGDKRQADHIDHDTLDNRRCNIRIVTPSQNQHNRKNVKGWKKQGNKYRAAIKANGKYIYLGLFDTPTEAHQAYLDAKKTYHPTSPINDVQRSTGVFFL